MPEVARLLRAYRAEEHFTQVDLARKWGESRDTISRWERGVSEPPMLVEFALKIVMGTITREQALELMRHKEEPRAA